MDFLWITLAAFIASILTTIIHRMTNSGTLYIDTSNPEKDLYRFVIKDSEFDKLPKKSYIVLKVDPKANLTQE